MQTERNEFKEAINNEYEDYFRLVRFLGLTLQTGVASREDIKNWLGAYTKAHYICRNVREYEGKYGFNDTDIDIEGLENTVRVIEDVIIECLSSLNLEFELKKNLK